MKIEIDTSRQQLILRDEKNVPVKTYSVSTSKNGLGERNGSFCTPRGSHVVRARIGAGRPASYGRRSSMPAIRAATGS